MIATKSFLPKSLSSTAFSLSNIKMPFSFSKDSIISLSLIEFQGRGRDFLKNQLAYGKHRTKHTRIYTPSKLIHRMKPDSPTQPYSQEDENTKSKTECIDRDWLLVQQTLSGEDQAFKRLFDLYYHRVFKAAITLCRDETLAADLTQETFLKAFRSLKSFQGNSNFYTWLYRILYNSNIDSSRKASNRYETQIEDDASSVLLCSSEKLSLLSHVAADPEQELLRSEVREIISNGLNKLSDSHRAVIILREVEDLSYDEISERLNCSLGTVMSRLHHARKKLAVELQNELSDSAMTLFHVEDKKIGIN